MKQDELAAIRERCEAATPGPFDTYVHGDNAGYTVAKFGDNGQDVFWTFVKREDAEFVAHAREDVPALLDEIDRLRAEVANLDAELTDVVHALIVVGAEDGDA